MKTLLQSISALTIIAVIAILGFLLGRYSYPKCPPITTRVDTIIMRDTIRDTIPVVKKSFITRIEHDTLRIAGDTAYVKVEIPIEHKIYETDDYRAEIEGFKPSLLSMEIYRQTHYITKIEMLPMLDKKRWGIGIHAGYGATMHSGQVILVPTVGVGVSYNIIRW